MLRAAAQLRALADALLADPDAPDREASDAERRTALRGLAVLGDSADRETRVLARKRHRPELDRHRKSARLLSRLASDTALFARLRPAGLGTAPTGDAVEQERAPATCALAEALEMQRPISPESLPLAGIDCRDDDDRRVALSLLGDDLAALIRSKPCSPRPLREVGGSRSLKSSTHRRLLPMSRQLFVTTALPYANAPEPHQPHDGIHPGRHLGALQRMRGHAVHFVCADDAHGAADHDCRRRRARRRRPSFRRDRRRAKAYLDGFHISFDNWSSTDAPENHALAQDIYRQLKKKELIAVKSVEQFFDPVKSMFCPTATSGAVPGVRHPGSLRRQLRRVRFPVDMTDLKNPVSALSGATPVLKSSEHYFFQLSSQRCLDFLKQWTHEPGRLQPEVLNKISEWFKVDEQGRGGLSDFGTSAATRRISASPFQTRRANISTSGSMRRSATWRH